MNRGSSRGSFGRGGGQFCTPFNDTAFTSNFLFTGRGGGRGGFQQRDLGPPDQILGTLTTIFILLPSFIVL